MGSSKKRNGGVEYLYPWERDEQLAQRVGKSRRKTNGNDTPTAVIRKGGGYRQLADSIFYIHRVKTIECGWHITVRLLLQKPDDDKSYLSYVWNTRIAPEVLKTAAKSIGAMLDLLRKHKCQTQIIDLVAKQLIEDIKAGLYKQAMSIKSFGTKKEIDCPFCDGTGKVPVWVIEKPEDEDDDDDNNNDRGSVNKVTEV